MLRKKHGFPWAAGALVLFASGGCGLLVGYDDYDGKASSTSSNGGGSAGGGGGAPSCDDGEQNGVETDEDCGGGDCDACPADRSCKETSDCADTLVCDATDHCCAPISCETADCRPQDDGCGGALECPASTYSYFCEEGNACLRGTCTCEGAGCTILSRAFGFSAGNAVAVDGSQNVVVVGLFRQKLQILGLPALQTKNPSGGGDADIFVAKFDAAGRALWAKSFGDSKSGYYRQQEATAVAIDGDGNIFVTGHVAGAGDMMVLDFGGKTAKAGERNAFVLKLLPDGTTDWVRILGEKDTVQGTKTVAGAGIGVDTDGNVYVTGNYEGSPSVGGEAFPDTADIGSDNAFYVARFDAKGNHVFSTGYHKPNAFGSSTGVALVVTTDGFVVTGEVIGTLDFGDDSLGHQSASSDPDLFVAKFDLDDGAAQWVTYFGGYETVDQPKSLALDASGNVLLSGNYNYAPAYVEGQSLLEADSSLNASLVVLEPNGGAAFAKGFGYEQRSAAGDPEKYARGLAVASDGKGGVLLAGLYHGESFSFGGVEGSVPQADEGSNPTLFVANFDGDRKATWARGFVKPEGNPTLGGIVADAAGNIYMTGSFTGVMRFGTQDWSQVGDQSMFLVKLAP